jgi:hypothetical protein
MMLHKCEPRALLHYLPIELIFELLDALALLTADDTSEL